MSASSEQSDGDQRSDEAAAVGKWAEQYRAQQQVRGALVAAADPNPIAPCPAHAGLRPTVLLRTKLLCSVCHHTTPQAYSYGGGSSSGSVASSSSSSGDGGGDASGGPPPPQQFLLPLMTLSKTKMPTESVPLQIFEPRYRLMFKLVNQSASRRCGAAAAATAASSATAAAATAAGEHCLWSVALEANQKVCNVL
jgi:hypothetical protein